MLKPICVQCRRFYRMKKSGTHFLEGKPDGPRREGDERHARPGHVDGHRWTPYKHWIGDLWECEGCHHQIISGTGLQPLREHYQEGFAEEVALHGADKLQINDC